MLGDAKIPELDRKGLRKFGWMTGGIFAGLFGVLFPWLFERPWPIWPWVILAVLGGLGLVAPLALNPIYRGWMRFGLLASRVTTPLILGAVFFLMISPMGVVRRALGYAEMRRPFDRAAQTYRVKSAPRTHESLERPF